jgi:uncharacterized protein YdcH (DUF465 family)
LEQWILETLGKVNIAELTAVACMMWFMYVRIEKKFDKVDAKFDKVDARFDKMDARFDRLESKVEDIDRRLCRVEGGLNSNSYCSLSNKNPIFKKNRHA